MKLPEKTNLKDGIIKKYALDKIIEVDAAWANYFRRRNILPVQETVESREDGSLVLGFLACSDEEIARCLKPWLPHVRILKPGYIGDLLPGDFRQWITWQSSTRNRPS